MHAWYMVLYAQYLILNDTQKEETEERGKNSCMIVLSSQKGK